MLPALPPQQAGPEPFWLTDLGGSIYLYWLLCIATFDFTVFPEYLGGRWSCLFFKAYVSIDKPGPALNLRNSKA